jgi:hypothetical protein
MRKTELTNGAKIFVVNVKQYVSLDVFTRALGNEYYDSISEKLENLINSTVEQFKWSNGEFEPGLDKLFEDKSFFKSLTKKGAEELLRYNLKLYGREGSIDTSLYEASYERGEAINRCYEVAREWVMKKYPHLQ